MKKAIIYLFIPAFTLILNFCGAQGPGSLSGQNYNYKVKNAILVPGKTQESQMSSLTIQESSQSIDYLTDAGILQQTVITMGSPTQKDLVSFKAFDNLGREQMKYLPYGSTESTGRFRASLPSTDFYNFYNTPASLVATDPQPVSKTIFELSPASRAVEMGGVGASWQPVSGNPSAGKTTKLSYAANVDNELKKWFIIDLGSQNYSLYYTFYGAGTVSLLVTTDTEGNISKEYKDLQGRTLCSKSYIGGGAWAETDYVYDGNGDLRFVLPPEAIHQSDLQLAASGGMPSNYIPITVNTTFSADTFSPNTYLYFDGVTVTLTTGTASFLPTMDIRPYPQAASKSIVTQYAYQYIYDGLHRKIGERIPGSDWKYFVYDNRNQLVLTQDGNQRPGNQWVFTKYDYLGRPILTGITTIGSTVDLVRTSVDSQTIMNEDIGSVVLGYTNNAYPNVPDPNAYLVATYYDNYSNCSFCQNSSYQFVSESWGSISSNEPYQSFTGVMGKTVGSSVKILGTNNWLNTVTYYNRHGNVIQTIGANHLSGFDRFSSLVDFSGRSVATLQTAVGYNSGTIVTLQKRFLYDHAGRLLTVFHKINNQNEIILSAYEYNELGQVVKKKLHSADNGTNYLQNLDFRYNIKQWLTNVNNIPYPTGDDLTDYFGLELAYNTDQEGSGAALHYNGLITAVKAKQDLGNKRRLYNFTYDNLSRLTSATHKMAVVDGAPWTGEADFYNESGLTYDLNGNIKTLNRNTETFNGAANVADPIDQLTYDYSAYGGNQLSKVTDTSPSGNKQFGFKDGTNTDNDYAYDANGNLTKDQNKGINSITYYFNNLPNRVTFNDGSYLQHTYDAAGIKLSAAYYNSLAQLQTTTDYVGNIVLLNGQVLVVNHDEGRITAPTYSNMIPNREAGSTDGFAPFGAVAITFQYVNSQTYVRAVAGSNTPANNLLVLNGIRQIGNIYTVKPGETYSFKVLGYSFSGNARLFITSDYSAANIWQGSSLPTGSANENWVMQNFTVPAGMTTMFVGVRWDGAISGDSFYINRVALYKTDFEYNYFLKDQVGSARVVLQTTPGTQVYTATMETENQATEGGPNGVFMNMNTAYIVTSPGNTTPGGDEVIRLNVNNRIGPAKSLKVYPGDQILASANSYYVSQGGYAAGAAAVVGAAVAGAFGGIQNALGDPGSIYQNVTQAYAGGVSGLAVDRGSASYPSAYLNYILFDKDYKPLGGNSSPISTNSNTPMPVSIPPINVQELGYVYIYLSYDNASGGDIFFDDFKITVTESPVIEVSNYYPFGLVSYTWLRAGETDNAYLFQGKELIAQTGWHDFGSRMYWADLGRWFAKDPQNQFSSPYLAMGNVPMMGRDPNGEVFGWDDVIVATVGFVVGDLEYAFTKGGGNPFSGKALLSGLTGAAIAEGGYLTLGGGLAGVGDVAEGAGVTSATGLRGTMEFATDYSILYGSSSAIDVAQNSDQIAQSSDWRAFGLIAGYSAMSAIQAGFQTDYRELKMDIWTNNPMREKGFLKGWNDGMLRGVLSDGIGGSLHGAGDALLGGYNPQKNSWDVDLGYVGREGYLSFAQGGSNKLIGNAFDKISSLAPVNSGAKLWDADMAKYTLLTPKQFGSVIGSQIVYNLLKRLDYNTNLGSNANFGNEISSWGRDYWKLLRDF